MAVDAHRETDSSATSPEHPNGAAWAAILAAGIGCASFGVITDLAEANARVNDALAWYRPAGGLSGVAGCAIIIWLAFWALFSVRWKHRQLVATRGIIMLSLALVLIGVLATFPPFYELFVGGD
jgi:hypothetical protein